ncbi:MAG: hypothetical protein ABIN58_08365 [candidate division WOR-3 bacterium]
MELTDKNLRPIGFAVLLIGIVATVVPALHQSSIAGLPDGDWTLAVRPYTGVGWESIPVMVVGVTTDATKGLTAEKVLLQNVSSKRVKAIKLGWYLRGRQETSVLLQGETPTIWVDIVPSEEKWLNYPVVTFDNIYHPLSKNGKVTGRYVIEILISSITYEDGSGWQISRITGAIPTWPIEKQRPAAALHRHTSGLPGSVANQTLAVSYLKAPEARFGVQEPCQDPKVNFATDAMSFCCTVNNCFSCTERVCREFICFGRCRILRAPRGALNIRHHGLRGPLVELALYAMMFDN